MSRFRHRLALKIVLPFAALTLAIGAVGTLTATSALNSRSQEAFDNQLVHDGFVAQSMVQAGDADRRAIFCPPASGTGVRPKWGHTPPPQTRPGRGAAIPPHRVVETLATPRPRNRGGGGPRGRAGT